MNRNLFLGILSMPLCVIAQERPNIIYIFTDQHSAQALSCMGNDDVSTPNIDRLADAGVLFTRAYCSAPLSGPSRTSMFTGFYSHEIGVNMNGKPLPKGFEKNVLGNLLSAAGYECAYAGKWHVHTSSMPEENSFGFEVIHSHNDNGLAETCADFLNRKHTKPFFLVASFDNPHNICEYARQQSLPYGEIETASLEDCPGLPANFAINPYDADVIAYEKTQNYSAYPTIYYTADDWRKYRYTYYKLVEKIDAEIGKIIDAIDKNKLWENTVVIFSSDHGDGMGAHQWNQKSALYEEVVNVPMIVTLPGKRNAGTVLPQLVNNGVDFYASVCDWAGVSPIEGTSGVSYRKLVEAADANMKHQENIVIETTFDKGTSSRGWCVCSEKYKYIMYDKGRYREQLYDMEKDRGEMRNLAVEAAYKDELYKYRTILSKWMDEHEVKGKFRITN